MKNYSFRVGVSVAIDSQRFRIMRILMDGHVQLEAESDGALSNTTYDELLKKYAEKRVSLSDETQADHATPKPMARSLSTFPESVQQRAIRKKRYLDFLLNGRLRWLWFWGFYDLLNFSNFWFFDLYVLFCYYLIVLALYIFQDKYPATITAI